MKIALLLLSLFFSAPFESRAQLCSGSPGDPIINVTFGTSRNPLPSGTTDFDYSRSCPGKGQYTLANLIFGCGEDKTWLMMAGDHTRDVNGNYMLVNAQSGDGVSTPAVVRRDTARNLCSNVQYVYSAWVTNTLQTISCGRNAVPASLSLKATTLSGVLLDSIYTGVIPIEDEKTWKEYGFSFTLPPGETAVVLTVSTIRKFGCGQGFAIDDITLRPCGAAITATLNGSAGPIDVCENFANDFVLKGAYGAGFTNPQVQWQNSLDTGRTWNDLPAATAVDYTVPQKGPGIVLYRMVAAEGANIRSPQCRFVSNVIYTNVHPLRPHQAPQNLLGCLGKDLLLPAKDPFADSNLWTGPNGFSSTQDKPVIPQISDRDVGLYQRKQDFGFGCTDVDSFYVKVYPSTTIMVPPEYSVCEGKSVTLSASGDGTFLWQPATGLSNAQVANPVASPRDSTQYKVTVTNSYGCKDSALVNVYVYRNPEVSAGSNKTIVRGDTVALDGAIKGTAVQYSWSPSFFISDNSVLSPKVFPPVDAQYVLTAESTVGCGKVESAVTVKVYNDIYVPDGFSPNNDGRNDAFKVIAADGYKVQRFLVYNRWGQVVYSAQDFRKGWDGRFKNLPQPQDTYVYFLQIRSAKGEVITRKGTVTLVR